MTRATGDRIGRYTLVRPLGRGGFAEVWEALLHGPVGFHKPVALKLLGQADATARAQLEREARLGARLHHPNVVATYELGYEDGQPFVSMELVRGATVLQLARARPLPPGVILDIGVQACAGLHHAHTYSAGDGAPGLVHRDIKPANLLVDRSGLVKVADLGIAAAGGRADDLSGTKGFAPPEQMVEGVLDARADLFALGATLYLLAARAWAFPRGVEWTRAAVAHRLAEPGFLDPVEAAVVGLGPVVGRCLRSDRRDRWPDAASLGGALAALRRHQPDGPALADLLVPAEDEPTEDAAPTVRQLDRTLGNLPVPGDAFVGRSALLAELRAALRAGARLLTLHGPGGSGKTRLALELARQLRGARQGGAWLVEAAEADGREALCLAVAEALGVDLQPGDAAEQLGHALAALGRAVLVVDHVERVVEHAGDLLAQWSQRAPQVAWLCASRIVLRAAGERVVPVGPLSAADGAALLLARAPRPLAPSERERVPGVVQAVEGMPLALELCAARLGAVGLVDVERQLGDRLAALAGGSTELPERHRSMRATLDGSWALLSDAAREALAQLACCEGGFSLEAAEAIVELRGGAWALDALQELVDASLVRVDGDRFRLPAVVAAYAAERDPAPAATGARHGRFFAQLGSPDAVEALYRRGGRSAYAALARELDNVLAACRRAVARRDPSVAVPTARAAWEVLFRRGPPQTGIALVQSVLALDLNVYAAAELTRICADACRLSERRAEASELFADAVASLHALGDRRGTAWALAKRGLLEYAEGAAVLARASLSEALELARAVGDRRLEGVVLGSLGALGDLEGWSDRHLRLCTAALAVHRELGNALYEAIALDQLGMIHFTAGRTSEAKRCWEDALRAHVDVASPRFRARVLGHLGVLAKHEGRLDEAARHYEASLKLHRSTGDRGQEGIARANLGSLLRFQGRIPEAQEQLELALAAHRDRGDKRSEAHVLTSLGVVRHELGDLAEARRRLSAALALHADLDAPVYRAIVLGNLGRLELDEGRLDAAAEALRSAEALCRSLPALGAVWAAYRGRCDCARGDERGGRARLASSVELLRALQHNEFLAVALCLEAEVADPAAARVALDEADACVRALGLPARSPIAALVAVTRERVLGA